MTEADAARPTLGQLEALRSTVSNQGVVEAARALGVSQPAVSKLIRQAERALGVTLLRREGNRALPTPEAQMLAGEVERLFGVYEAIQRQAAALRDGEAAVVTVAAIPTQASRYLVPAVRAFRDRFPRIGVRMLVLTSQPVAEAVADGHADFGLVHSFMEAHGAQVEDLGLQHMVCIAPPGHRFAALEAVHAGDLEGESVVSYGAGTSVARWLGRAFRAEGAALRVDVEVSASTTLAEAVKAGIGVAVIEAAALDERDLAELVVRPFRPALAFHSRVLRSPQRVLSNPAAALLDAYRAIVSAPGPAHHRI